MSLTKDDYAIYLPAVNDSYAAEVCKQLNPERPFPADLTLRDLIFWEPNALWYYPYLLHSVGLYRVGASPDNAVTQRKRDSSTLVGDSGGFQIGRGSMKGLKHLRASPMPALAAVQAWKEEFTARQWIVGWLDTYANYAMTIDMPLWATTNDGKSSPFHNCSTQQLIDMTVNNLEFIESRAGGRAKWLNVVQGSEDTAQIQVWWNAVKWFRKGGWAMAGSAGAMGGLLNMLSTLLMMRDEGAFDAGQDWVHVLGVSTTKWAVLLSGIQQALRKINPVLRVSFDSSSPFQTGGRYEDVSLSPEFTCDERSWTIGTESAPQSRLHSDLNLAVPFAHRQSPIGQRLMLNQLSVRDGVWDQRQFDSVSNTLLTNHNVWVYLDAMKTANDLAQARDKDRVPALYIECLDFIEDIFSRGSWKAYIGKHRSLLDSVARTGYRVT